jgi:hypothetical protein
MRVVMVVMVVLSGCDGCVFMCGCRMALKMLCAFPAKVYLCPLYWVLGPWFAVAQALFMLVALLPSHALL